MTGDESRWRIKEFAVTVGVPEATLRAWERRYKLLEPERSPGGYRLYSRDDVRRIRSMQAHMARGLAAAQAAALAVAEVEVEVVAPARPEPLVDALLLATEELDATRFDATLDAAFTFGRTTAIDAIVLPTLVQIGLRWETAAMSVGHEHFASHLIERRLLALAKGWEAGSGPRALLACPSGERHTLGLVCCGLLLDEGGWRVAYLGADTPVAQIADVAASVRPDVVILCALGPLPYATNAEDIAALAARHRTLLGGAGATAKLAARIGAEHAADDPVQTAHRLVGAPPATAPDQG